ncbi:hypothetical protein GCM10023195_10950 [Actinoallomurus liliacearum]|uniref:Peptidase inhibitor family I36 n=1 Tax=Actinoallomurus liliacearum TaxID=1080073 RepID=A0ABP8TE72_9ACTN
MALPKFKHAVLVRLAGVALAGTAGLMAFTGLTATPAHAQGWNVTGPHNAQCKGAGLYCLYYHQDVWYSNNAEWSFNNYTPDLGSWKFDLCSGGGSGSCEGWNTYIRNNAASMSAVGCAGMTVWYSPNYTGNFNWIEGGSWGNLNSYLVNNEASTSKGNLC